MKIIFGGSNKIPGYTTIDINGEADITHDIRLRWPFKNNSADVIFGSHVLEHLTKIEGKYVIQECNRILKINGTLRLSVPDLRLFAEKFVNNDITFYKEVLNMKDGPIDGTMSERFMYVVSGMGHKYQYDVESLHKLLKDCGFDEINKRQYRESDIPEIDLLDNRPEQSLFVEARKRHDLEQYAEGCVSRMERLRIHLHICRKMLGRRFPILKRFRRLVQEKSYFQR